MITDDEMATMVALQGVLLHICEKLTYHIQEWYEQRYKESKQYDQLCKQYSEVYAQQIVTSTVAQHLKHDDRWLAGRVITKAKELQTLMDKFTNQASGINGGGREQCQTFDRLMSDTNMLLKLVMLFANADGYEENDKLIETLTPLCTAGRISEETIKMITDYKA